MDGLAQKLTLFVPAELTKWPPEQILYFDWPNFKNLLLWNNWSKFNQTLQKWCMDGPSLCSGWTNKMAARANSSFCLVNFQKSFPLKLLDQNLTKLCKNDLWMVLHKLPSFCNVPVELPKWPPELDPLFWLAEFQTSSSYETTGPNSTKLCRNDVWMVLQKNTTFGLVEKTKWLSKPSRALQALLGLLLVL